MIDAIANYWNHRIHDLEMTEHPVGTKAFFADLDDYRFDKLHYLPRLVDFSGFRGQRLLEVGCGIGTDLVRFAKGGARVTGVDLAQTAIDLARKNFDLNGVTAEELRVANGEKLPFPDASFDVVYGHGVIQYTADAPQLIREMHRVLKPGGRIATAVWDGPEKNFWVTAMMGTINKNMELPPPPPGAPGMFRCARPGLMKEVFDKAGFRNINEHQVASKLNSGNADTYWNMMTEIGDPIVAALSKADDTMRQKIKKEVFELVTRQYPGEVAIDAGAIVISAEK